MKKLFNILVILLTISCLALTACTVLPNIDARPDEDSTVVIRPNDSQEDSSISIEEEDSSSSSDSSGDNEEEDKPLRVIFFGNSLMFFNDMPSLFKNLAEKSGKEIYVDSVTRGSATISDFANSSTDVGSQAYRKLQTQSWDYVIIEPSRRITPYENTVFEAELAAAKVMQRLATNAGAEILLYCVWGNNDGTLTEYNASNPIAMTKVKVHYDYTRKDHVKFLRTVSERISQALGGVGIIDAGYAFENSIAEYPSINLYDTDKRHPSLEGSYLAAATVYATIYGKSPENIGFTGGSVLYFEMQRMAAATVIDGRIPDLTNKTEEIEQVDDPTVYDILFIGSDLVDNYDATPALASMINLSEGLTLNINYMTNSTGVLNGYAVDGGNYLLKDTLARTKFDAIVLQITRRCTPTGADVEASELAALKKLYPVLEENTDNIYLYTFNGQSNPSIFTTASGDDSYTKTDASENLTVAQMNEYYTSIAKSWAEETGCKYILQGSAWTASSPASDSAKGYVRALALYYGIFDKQVPAGVNTNGVEQSVAAKLEEEVAKYCLASYEAPVIPELPNPDTYDVLVIGSKLIDNLNVTDSLASMVQIGQGKELYLEYVTHSVGVFNKLSNKDASDSFYSDYLTAMQSRRWDAIVLQISRRCTPGSAVEIAELNAIKAILPELKDNTQNLFLVTLIATENPNIFVNEGIEYAKSSYKLSATVAEMTEYFNGVATSWAQEIGAKAILHGAAWAEANPATNAEKAYLRACCLYNTIFASRVPSSANTNGVSAEVASSLRKIAFNHWLEKTPADLTALNSAIAMAEGKKESEYTTNSWNALKGILAEAKLLNGLNDQEEIDAAVLALNGAIEALVLKSDLSLLTALIAEVKALDKENYTPNSFALLTEPLARATALTGDNTQEEVNGAYNALNEAKQALVLRADFTALNSAITTANGKVESNYTQASWQALISALNEAKALDFNATQEEVNAKASRLNGAIEALIVKADLTALNEAIALAESKVEGEYTIISWNALKEALASAKLLDENSDMGIVGNATVALNNAIAGLVLKANLSELNALLGEIALLEKDSYTEESWQALQAEIESAKALNSESAQADVDEAVSLIRNAKNALEELVETDLTQLTLLIAEIELLDEKNYTLASWTALETLMAGAEGMSKENTQEEIDQAVAVISEAKQALVLIPTYETYDILFIGSDLIEDEYIAVSLSSMISLGQGQELHLEYVTDGVGVISRLVYREDENNNEDVYTRTRNALNARRWDSIIIQFSRRATPESTVANSELAALKAIYPTLTRNCDDIYIFTLNGSSSATIFSPEGVSYTSTGEKSTLSAAEMGTYYQTVVEGWCAELGCKSIFYGSAYNEMAPSTSKAKGFMRALCIYYSIFNEEMPSGTDVQGTSSSGVKKIKAAAAKYCLG